MAHAARNHVGDGFKAAMRMVWKAGNVIVGVIAAEGIEHQKGVQPLLQVLRQHPRQQQLR